MTGAQPSSHLMVLYYVLLAVMLSVFCLFPLRKLWRIRRLAANAGQVQTAPAQTAPKRVYKRYEFDPQPHICEEDFTCPVCLDDVAKDDKVIELSCGHSFHPPCVINWVFRKGTCPLCREQVAKRCEPHMRPADDFARENSDGEEQTNSDMTGASGIRRSDEEDPLQERREPAPLAQAPVAQPIVAVA